MCKSIYYVTPDGVEVIDNTPQAEIRLSSMEYIEERQHKRNRKRKSRKNPLWKIAGLCGII